MWRRLTSKPARERLAFAALSLLIVWHTIAMAIASAPESEIIASARLLFHPYLTLFRLDNNWGFFAPTVELGGQFRYVVEDGAGQRSHLCPGREIEQVPSDFDLVQGSVQGHRRIYRNPRASRRGRVLSGARRATPRFHNVR